MHSVGQGPSAGTQHGVSSAKSRSSCKHATKTNLSPLADSLAPRSVVPETRNLSLEQLAAVFSISSRTHALFGLREAAWFFRKYVFRHTQLKRPVLVRMEDHPVEEDVDYHGGLDRTFSIS